MCAVEFWIDYQLWYLHRGQSSFIPAGLINQHDFFPCWIIRHCLLYLSIKITCSALTCYPSTLTIIVFIKRGATLAAQLAIPPSLARNAKIGQELDDRCQGYPLEVGRGKRGNGGGREKRRNRWRKSATRWKKELSQRFDCSVSQLTCRTCRETFSIRKCFWFNIQFPKTQTSLFRQFVHLNESVYAVK